MTKFKYMTPDDKKAWVRDMISRREADSILSEGGTLDDVPPAIPDGTELVMRSDMSDIICMSDDGFTDTMLVALLDKAKEVGAIQCWDKVNPNEYDYSRDYQFTTVSGDTYIIEWWKNIMYLKVGGMKMEFHYIELGHENCGSFGAWTFWLSRFQRPYLGRGHFCGSIQCETHKQYLQRTRKE